MSINLETPEAFNESYAALKKILTDGTDGTKVKYNNRFMINGIAKIKPENAIIIANCIDRNSMQLENLLSNDANAIWANITSCHIENDELIASLRVTY